jgi:hypothetical protein
MQTLIDISCPVSTARINENVARAAAFYVIAVATAGILLNSYIIIFLLAADFALRAFTNGNASPVKFLSKQTVKLLNIQARLTDAAPKKFAAGMGFVFCAAIASLLLAGLFTAAAVVAGVLFFCALLEGAAGICLGCIVYTLMVLPLTKKL